MERARHCAQVRGRGIAFRLGVGESLSRTDTVGGLAVVDEGNLVERGGDGRGRIINSTHASGAIPAVLTSSLFSLLMS